jgi:hypothetical protein
VSFIAFTYKQTDLRSGKNEDYQLKATTQSSLKGTTEAMIAAFKKR